MMSSPPSFIKMRIWRAQKEVLWGTVYDLARDQVEGREANKVLARAVNEEYIWVLRDIAFMEGHMTEVKHLEGIARGLVERKG